MPAASPTEIDALVESECRFDVATPQEVSAAYDRGIDPARLIWTDPGVAYAQRFALVAVDDRAGIDRLAELSPRQRVILRSRAGSPDTGLALGVRAALRGLRVVGLGVGHGEEPGAGGVPGWNASIRLGHDLRRIGVAVDLFDVALDDPRPTRMDELRQAFGALAGGPRVRLVFSVPRSADSR